MKIEEITPLFTQAIKILRAEGWNKYHEFCVENKLSMGTFDRCLVGEAHGFSDGYMKTCKMCEDMALELCINLAVPNKFEESKKTFENHFCEAHSK